MEAVQQNLANWDTSRMAMKKLNCMFDTNVFNRVLDAKIRFQPHNARVSAFATHIQRDEINNTKDAGRRTALAEIFNEIVSEPVPTESAICGVSKWGQAKWGAGDNFYSRLKTELDKLNKNKKNNTQDALIAETSIKCGYTLVTDDADLADVTKKFGGKCLSVAEFLRQYVQ